MNHFTSLQWHSRKKEAERNNIRNIKFSCCFFFKNSNHSSSTFIPVFKIVFLHIFLQPWATSSSFYRCSWCLVLMCLLLIFFIQFTDSKSALQKGHGTLILRVVEWLVQHLCRLWDGFCRYAAVYSLSFTPSLLQNQGSLKYEKNQWKQTSITADWFLLMLESGAVCGWPPWWYSF